MHRKVHHVSHSDKWNVARDNKEHPPEIEFSILDGDNVCKRCVGEKNKATVIDRDGAGIGMLTPLPLQPGNIVKFMESGTATFGIVMWSVESADNYRIQVRYLKP